MKNKIINLAAEQIGNNYEKYCRDMGYNYRIEWCACFISWLAKKLDITDIVPVDMSCNRQIAKFKDLDAWHTDRNFQSGDIIYYDWDFSGDADHVGIIEHIADGKLIVIEGNNGDFPNDLVRRREISCESSLIYGYARPKYSKSSDNDIIDVCDVKISLPMLRKGCTGKSIKSLQILLEYLGYSLGKYGIDGEFGTDTQTAVKEFQKSAKIEVDGIVGEDTWSKLMK